MKKIISMMLMLCAIITFSACSSDDDGPTNPLSNVVVPQTAQIGSEMTVQGTGFADGQTILLQLTGSDPVEVAARFTSAGATFEVPYTLTEGTASVVLKMGDNNWPIGAVTLTAPANPVSAFTMPTEIALSSEQALSGIGFKDGDMLVFEHVYIDQTGNRSLMIDKNPIQPVEVPISVTGDDVSVAVPQDMADGDYSIYLKRGNNTWPLGTTYVYQPKRIKSIYFENGLLAMIGAQSVTMNFSYNDDGSLAAVTSPEGLSWTFTYNGDKVSTTSPLFDNPLEFTMENGKIVKSTAAKAEEAYETTKYNYWTYNADTLVSVTNKDNWYRGLQLTGTRYAYNNLDSISFGGDVLFSSLHAHAVPGTIDVRYLLDMFSYIYQGEDIFVGMLLNSKAVASSYLPAMERIVYLYPGESGYETRVADVELNTTFSDNVLTIDFLSFKDLEMITGTYGSKIIVTYENK